MTNNYLSNLKERRLEKEVKDCAAFGIILGGILFIINGWFYWFTPKGDNPILPYLMAISALMFICGVIIPQILYYPQKLLTSVGNFIFLIFFKILLLATYILIILPSSLIYKRKNTSPFYSWKDTMNIQVGEWTEKVFNYSNEKCYKYSNTKIFQYLNVVKFFIDKKQWVLIPILIALLIFGLIFTFIQSSLIAPLIYTIF